MVDIDIIMSEQVSDTLPVDTERLRIYAADILSRNGIESGEVNIIFIDDKFMAELNRTYKGREGTTDVLSFDLSNEFTEGLVGEIYISQFRARTQSAELSVPFEEELVRLAIHGLLHLSGQVHDTDAQYEEMTHRTDELVKEFFLLRGAE